MHYVIPWVHYHKYHVVADVVRNVFLNLRLGSDRIKLLDTGFVMAFPRAGRQRDFRDCRSTARGFSQGMQSPILFVERVTIPPFVEGDEFLRIVLRGVRDPIGGTSIFANGLVFDLDIHDIGDQNRRDDGDDDLRSDQLLAEVLRGVHPAPRRLIYTLFRRCCASLMPPCWRRSATASPRCRASVAACSRCC
jgi:hypothetical protein